MSCEESLVKRAPIMIESIAHLDFWIFLETKF